LKHATTTTKPKVTKVRAEVKTFGTADVNATAMLPGQCRLNDKLSILFELLHTRRICSHFLSEKFWMFDVQAGHTI